MAKLQRHTTCNVLVIGAGAAGMMAAMRAAERGLNTILLEKNMKPGVKILMSGGTRCNLTQNTDAAGIVEAFGRPGRFLYSALAAFSPSDLMQFFHQEGVATKVEATGKVFPVSDRALDVQRALHHCVGRSGCNMILGRAAESIDRSDDGFRVTANGHTYTAVKLIITTGGKSYPGCGTCGDGYPWAAAFGHTIVTPHPALVPITTAAGWATELQGVTVPQVRMQVVDTRINSARKKVLIERTGSTLFTHFGLSGPAPMDASREVARHPSPRDLRIICDFLPGISSESLASRWQALGQSDGSRRIVREIARHMPSRLAATIVAQARLPAEQRFADLPREARQRVVQWTKSATLPVIGTRGYKKAEVTAGGVHLSEVDPRTMESKIAPGLYFAGEILDLDGPIGGYNFQAAFSTGQAAGMHA